MTIELSYSESHDIGAPIETVFDYRLDYLTLPDYNHNVTNIRRIDGGSSPGVGAEYRFDLSLPGWEQKMEAFLKVLDLDRPNEIVTDTGSDVGLAGREVNTFTRLPDGKTRLTITLNIDLPDEAKEGLSFIEQSGRDQYVLELEVMKKILEGGS